MTTNEEKLFPCPFCGEKEDIYVSNEVSCGNCGASTAYHGLEDTAINNWNTRHDPHAEIAEELAEALIELIFCAHVDDKSSNVEYSIADAKKILQKYEKMKGEKE